MSLFSIQRFGVSQQPDTDENAKQILSKLKERLKSETPKSPKDKTEKTKRKKAKHSEPETATDTEISPARKKKKSNKHDTSHTVDESETETEKRKSKKKKKRKENSENTTSPSNEDELVSKSKRDKKSSKAEPIPSKRTSKSSKRTSQNLAEEQEDDEHTNSDNSDGERREDSESSADERKSEDSEYERDTGEEAAYGDSEGEPLEDSKQGNQVVGGFTVISKVQKKDQAKVERILPEWLSHPSLVALDIRTHLSPIHAVKGLSQHITEKLHAQGITSFFPVQAELIPALLNGVRSRIAGFRPPDICCSAPTGSGKTLSYVLPIVQALSERVCRQIRALIVLPTRELAIQVKNVFDIYCEDTGTDLKAGLVAHGKGSFSEEQEQLVMTGPRGGLLSCLDILVATPGRLVDHINNTPGFTLEHLKFLVIDEADRVMEEVKQDWLGAVERMANQESAPLTVRTHRQSNCFQKLLFSATLSHNPEKLQELKLFQPRLFTSGSTENGANKMPGVVKGDFIGKYTTPSGLKELCLTCSRAEKPLIVLHLMLTRKYKHVLCFTNSKESAHKLMLLVKLVGGVDVKEISSVIRPEKRQRIIKKFTEGRVQMLICTDALSRGLDLPRVDCVLSYDVPHDLNTYVHRVGRTARAGATGQALTLVEEKQSADFNKWLQQAGKANLDELVVYESELAVYVEPLKQALAQLPQILQDEKKSQRTDKKKGPKS